MTQESSPLWLEDFMFLSRDTEIPEKFGLWCGLSTISLALGRKIWMDMGVYKIFPNLFVVLCAGSGKCRKSTAIGQVELLVKEIDPKPNIISQKITPEALIEAMQVGKVGCIAPTSCTGYIIVDELSTFLNKKSYEGGIASLLISLFDCKERFVYQTRGRGKEVLKNTCLGLLGGSTIEWIRNALPGDSIGGGLTSRIVFVYEKMPKPPMAWTKFGEEHERAILRLLAHLKKIARIEGEVVVSDDCRRVYEDSYNCFYKNSKLWESKLLQGYASRRFIHVFKVAMLISMSYNEELVIEVGHFQAAERIMEETERNMEEVLNLVVQTESGGVVEDIVQTIIANGGKMSKGELTRKFQHKLRARELDDAMKTLVQGGRIKPSFDGRKITYVVGE